MAGKKSFEIMTLAQTKYCTCQRANIWQKW